MPKAESFLVLIIAIIALVSIVFFITVYYKDIENIGKAVLGKKDCGCVQVEKPVCGKDGVTYSNACLAFCMQAHIAHEGNC